MFRFKHNLSDFPTQLANHLLSTSAAKHTNPMNCCGHDAEKAVAPPLAAWPSHGLFEANKGPWPRGPDSERGEQSSKGERTVGSPVRTLRKVFV